MAGEQRNVSSLCGLDELLGPGGSLGQRLLDDDRHPSRDAGQAALESGVMRHPELGGEGTGFRRRIDDRGQARVRRLDELFDVTAPDQTCSCDGYAHVLETTELLARNRLGCRSRG